MDGIYMKSSALSGSPLISDDEDAIYALEINKKITRFVVTPVAIVGLFMNCVVVYTWSKYISKSNQVAIFLFKCLAVVDNVYIATFVVWYHSPASAIHTHIFRWICYSSRDYLVSITLLMSVFRWMALKFPFHFRSLSSPFRVRLALGVVLGYCVCTKSIEISITYTADDQFQVTVTQVAIDQFNLSIPLLIQLGLSVSILWMTKKITYNVHHRGPMGPKLRKISKRLTTGRNRRLTSIVITISVITFVAYPIGVTLITYFKLFGPHEHGSSMKRIVLAVVNFLHVFNSSFNFIVYFAYMPEFRTTFLKLCRCKGKVMPIESEQSSRKKTKANLFESDTSNNCSAKNPLETTISGCTFVLSD